MIYSYYVGNIAISNPMTYLNSILTCISTGGPATAVIWTRKSPSDVITVVNESLQSSSLDTTFTGHYTHTLKVSQIDVATVYECFVSNNKPSSAKAVASLNMDGMSIILHIFCWPAVDVKGHNIIESSITFPRPKSFWL